MSIPESPCFSTRDCRHSSRLQFRHRIASLLTAFIVLVPSWMLAQTSSYVQTNIVSDGSVKAQKTDPTLINPWGVSIGQEFWINTAGTGFSLVDDASGNKAFAVAIPPASSSSPHGAPAGTVFNSDTSIFNIPGSGSANFLFGNLDGTIAAWNTNTPQAVIVANNFSSHAVYTDIAVAKNNTGTFLLGANFAGGTVDVFDSNFSTSHFAGGFSDPSLPAGYHPFGIHTIGNNVYVTYAQVNDQGLETVGAGLGYVNQFDLNGNFVQRALSQGNLNAPWGMALAPQGFGSLGGSLLVGNFGDGVINAYDPNSFSLKGQIAGSDGAPLANTGLWEIVFGAGTTTGGTAATTGDPNTLYFAAGINNEKGGLFGSISAAPAAGSGDFTISASSQSITVTNGQVGNLSLNLGGENGFTGTVNLSCSGLPTGDSCNFSPASVNVSGTTPVMVGISIATGGAASPAPTPAPPSPPPPTSPYIAKLHRHSQTALTGLIPLGLLGFVGFRKRLRAVRSSVLVVLFMLTVGMIAGCSSGKSAAQMPATPAPPTSTPPPSSPAPTTSQITITANSGTLSHSVSVNLTTD